MMKQKQLRVDISQDMWSNRWPRCPKHSGHWLWVMDLWMWPRNQLSQWDIQRKCSQMYSNIKIMTILSCGGASQACTKRPKHWQRVLPGGHRSPLCCVMHITAPVRSSFFAYNSDIFWPNTFFWSVRLPTLPTRLIVALAVPQAVPHAAERDPLCISRRYYTEWHRWIAFPKRPF